VGYSVGGKSGTARKQVGKSYAAGKYRAWFTGMAPIDRAAHHRRRDDR
jgi:cell division protein FtsI (penicillin-binding protein 3)